MTFKTTVKARMGSTSLTLSWRLALLLSIILTLLVFVAWWRGSGVGAQVQVPMFYDDHYVYPRPWTQAQEAPGVPAPFPLAAVYERNRISQPFVSSADQLSMVEVWLAGSEGTIVSVSISADDGTAYLGDFSLDAGMQGAYYRLKFPPIADSRDRMFWITLSATASSRAQPVVTRSVGGDRLGGSLRLNEYSRPGNMELYTYSRGRPGVWWPDVLVEQLLPKVFLLRVQQYKPEAFKGTLFPGLLVGMTLLSLVFLAAARPSGQTLAQALGWGLSGLLLGFLVWQVGSGRLHLLFSPRMVDLEKGSPPLAVSPGPQQGERLVNDFVATLWTAERLPEARFVTAEIRSGLPAIRVPGESHITYPMTVPLNGRLRAGSLVIGDGRIRFEVKVGDQTLWNEMVVAGEAPRWADLNLTSWGGQAVNLQFVTRAIEGEPEGAWLMPQLAVSPSWLLPDPVPPALDYNGAHYRLGESVELVGYTTHPAAPIAGDLVEVTLLWRALKSVDAYATVFVHLVDEEGRLITQDDAQPVNNTYPISNWQPGTVVVDTHTLTLPNNWPGSQLSLAIGLYNPVNLAVWPVSTAGGDLVSDGRILLPYDGDGAFGP